MSDNTPREPVTFQDVLDFYRVVEDSTLGKKIRVPELYLTFDESGTIRIDFAEAGSSYSPNLAGRGGPVTIKRAGDEWLIRRLGPDGGFQVGDILIGSDGWPVLEW
jgi:hypothetical protein